MPTSAVPLSTTEHHNRPRAPFFSVIPKWYTIWYNRIFVVNLSKRSSKIIVLKAKINMYIREREAETERDTYLHSAQWTLRAALNEAQPTAPLTYVG